MNRARLLTRKSKDPVAHVLKAWLAVPPAAARVVAALYAASGEVVSRAALMEASGQTRAGLELSIKRLRAAMDGGAIITVPAEGFRLTTGGIAECERALADAGVAGRRAA